MAIVVQAVFLGDGGLVSTGIDGTIRLWDTAAPDREIDGDVTNSHGLRDVRLPHRRGQLGARHG